MLPFYPAQLQFGFVKYRFPPCVERFSAMVCYSLLVFIILEVNLNSSAFAQSSAITAVWANDGEDKVTQDEVRATGGQTVANSLWDGTTIKLFGGKNEVINFNLVLEAASSSATNVTVTMSNLNGPNGSVIRYATRSTGNLFNWTTTESELFYIRYLQILGLSYFGYGAIATFQEPTFPQRAQCPTGTGCAWATRPVANKYYPDIAVPIELVPNFSIAAGNNQSIWADIYIPKTAVAGSYSGTVTISENGVATHTVPVSLIVRNFTLPNVPSSKTMLVTGYGDDSLRYTGVPFPNTGTAQDLLTKQVLQTQFLVAHRHKLSLIDDNFGQGWSSLQPASQWLPFLSGTAFTSSNGYAGPGVSTGQDVFSIGTYGGMTDNASETQSTFTDQLNGWESWFEANSPSTERFVYLCDEIGCQNNTPTLATQLQWWQAISGVGHNVHTLATQPLKNVVGAVLSNPTSTWSFSSQAFSSDQANANTVLAAEPARRLYAYNGARPGSGSLIIEDEGTSARELPWAQYKKQVDRFFFWETTYYDDYQNGRGNNNVFTTADTFGQTSANSMYGQVGGSNGNGVLFYPGTDTAFPANSYGINGPIVSLRLKHWRRGIQDVDYLTLANAINPTAVTNLVTSMVPSALWENQCHDLSDCTYFIGPVSWSHNPDDWESARSQLADIIAPQSGVTASLTANSTSIANGQSSTLTWSSSNASSCTGTNFSTGNTASGSAAVSPTATTTYTVTCSGSAGSSSASATVTVSAGPTATLTANPILITSGQSSTLTWSSTSATSCASTNFSTGNATSGSAAVSPTATTTYSISCTGTAGTTAASATVAVINGLHGAWLLDEGSGTTTADSSGNGNTGTFAESPLPAWTTGVTGKGLGFGGSGGFVSFPNSASLNNLPSQGGGGMSVVAWVYPTSSGGNAYQTFLDKQIWSLGFYGTGGAIFSHICSSGAVQAYTDSNSVPFNQWSQIVATWTGSTSGSSIVIYLNGSVITRNSQDCSGSLSDDSSYTLTLGGTYYHRNPFVGTLDDVLVYNRVLSASEVGTLYSAR
ncbi:MAG TPA: glycoside hydrolase domain-containing protein [Candidatus Angelobacter sp.]|nr:glycoside hydrolase domain-containing protein [Candidatus Angelobacter sp.]